MERGRPGAVRILNGVVAVTENGLREADQRYAGVLMRDVSIDESSKGAVTPGVSSIEGGVRKKTQREVIICSDRWL